MSRYRPIATTWDSDISAMIHMRDSVEVHQTDNGPQPTGILDANGTPLYRITPTVRFGFHKS